MQARKYGGAAIKSNLAKDEGISGIEEGWGYRPKYVGVQGATTAQLVARVFRGLTRTGGASSVEGVWKAIH